MIKKALLKIEIPNESIEEEYDVVESEYGIHQGTDDLGQPTRRVLGGKLTVTVQSNMYPYIVKWAFNNTRGKATLIYKKDDDSGAEVTAKEVIFEDAYCVEYSEKFATFDNNNPTLEKFTLSARVVTVEDVEHANEWLGEFGSN